MIRSCRDRETEKLLNRLPTKKYRAVERAARIKLELLNAASALHDLMLPGLHLEKLKGDRKGQYSIRINAQYRICFGWTNQGAENVEITDYH
ncbi:MAG: type II toxin-antitoxin system RelE/ParE family toxin [Bryobacteraceae bacterium]|jgi:proteic killer suppression protein